LHHVSQWYDQPQDLHSVESPHRQVKAEIYIISLITSGRKKVQFKFEQILTTNL